MTEYIAIPPRVRMRINVKVFKHPKVVLVWERSRAGVVDRENGFVHVQAVLKGRTDRTVKTGDLEGFIATAKIGRQLFQDNRYDPEEFVENKFVVHAFGKLNALCMSGYKPVIPISELEEL